MGVEASSAASDQPAALPEEKPLSWRGKLLVLAVSSLICTLVAEAVLRWGLASPGDRLTGPKAALERNQNQFTTVSNPERCQWSDSTMAHPFLGLVHHRQAPCGNPQANAAGFLTGDFAMPLERDPRFFTVLIEGGSVAQQLGAGPWLSRALEAKYRLSEGRRFRVLNAAMGSTAHPRSPVVTLLYGHLADAVVAIDGFNEVANSSPHLGVMLGTPSPVYLQQLKGAGSRLGARVELARMLREKMAATPVLTHTFLWLFSYRALSSVLLGSAGDAQAPAAASFGPGTYLDYHRAPSAWDLSKRKEWNAARYEEGVRSNFALARSLNIAFSHFLQPVPNLFKPLTRHEFTLADRHFPSDYYVELDERFKRAAEGGLPTFSLLKLYEGVKGEVYSDMVHCATSWNEPGGPVSAGYERMAGAIADAVGPAWGLTPL